MNINKAIQSAFEHYQSGNLQQAEHICRKILKIQPDNVGILHFLGVICYQLGKYDSAIKYIKKALQFNPNYAEAYNNLGTALKFKGQLDEAISCYQKAIKFNPNYSDAYYNLGNIYIVKEQLDEAITCYQKAIKYNPGFAASHNNLGNVLRDKGQLDEAILYYQKALQLNPNLADAYNNLGIALKEKGQIDEAIMCYRKAIERNPVYAEAYNHLGNALQDKGQIDEAIAYYQMALQLNPDYAGAHGNMSFALLLSGNFMQGWKEYEWRWKTKEFYQRNFSQPLWDGSDITGRTILLHAEQGAGDTIQFIRYAPLVAQHGARVIVECHKELKSLLKNVEGVQQVIAHGEQLPELDIHCPLLSLPFVFSTTLESIPAKIPYIRVAPMLVQRWREKVQHDNSKFKIGLVWSGSPKFKDNRYRSCSLELFSFLAQLDDVTFYSLQKGEAAEQAKNPPEGMKLFDYTEEINDFSDTAAFIENLDLIISVDTAVAHLAGALGRPVWTLLQFVPDWRWLLNREDSPWYSTMRLFRQSSPGDWKQVIARIKEELNERVQMSIKL